MESERSEQRAKILVVEDELIVATDLKETLVELGYDVTGIAQSGQKALEMIAENRPDLVLMDIFLRGSSDGIAAAATIKQAWQLPVIFLTANTSEQVLAKARATEPFGYLIKPFRSQELNATVLVALKQHQLSRELFSRNEWLQTVLGALSDAVIATSDRGAIRYLNPAAEQITGWSMQDSFQKTINEFLQLNDVNDTSLLAAELQKVLETLAAAGPHRFTLLAKDGRKIPVESFISPIHEHGVVSGLMMVLRDISERLHREGEAEKAKGRLERKFATTAAALGQTQAELHALSGHLITAQEDERRRVARELHDDLGQRVAVLEMLATQALHLVPAKDSAISVFLQDMREQTAALSNGLRSMSHQLHPSLLGDLGIVSALNSLVDEFRRSGVEVSAHWSDKLPALSIELGTALYRITQEALRNASKHAPGSPAHVTLECVSKEILLTIEDAGPGSDMNEALARGGLGLLSMQERARLAGGTFTFSTRREVGTLVMVRVPIQ